MKQYRATLSDEMKTAVRRQNALSQQMRRQNLRINNKRDGNVQSHISQTIVAALQQQAVTSTFKLARMYTIDEIYHQQPVVPHR